jgi:hypothetical protein
MLNVPTPDLIRQICCTIEDMTSGKNIDKLELFLKIHKCCFGQMDEKEIQTVKKIIIIYLNDNNKIKARSLLSKIWRFLKGILLKK